MVNAETVERIARVYPFLKTAGKEIRDQLAAHTILVNIPKGKIIFLEGDECKQLALILSGMVRVYKPAESGREITLYRLGPGESCVLTASCIFSKSTFGAIAVTEEDVEAAVIPSPVFREWVNHYEIWRTYVFDLLSKRLSEIIATVEEVTFRRMDARVAEYLTRLAQVDRDEIHVTHQDIAMELGTSREVISRILKHFESENALTLGRGTITILDLKGLAKKAEHARP